MNYDKSCFSKICLSIGKDYIGKINFNYTNNIVYCDCIIYDDNHNITLPNINIKYNTTTPTLTPTPTPTPTHNRSISSKKNVIIYILLILILIN